MWDKMQQFDKKLEPLINKIDENIETLKNDESLYP